MTTTTGMSTCGSGWAKNRVFVRQLEGTYSDLYQALVDQPRVYSSRDLPWKGGPQLYGKHVISPQVMVVTQSIETHIEVYAPGAYGQKHGHLNSAVFYVLKGRGHDIHDGKRIEWRAGDVMIVENGCVHQHFNDDPDNEVGAPRKASHYSVAALRNGSMSPSSDRGQTACSATSNTSQHTRSLPLHNPATSLTTRETPTHIREDKHGNCRDEADESK